MSSTNAVSNWIQTQIMMLDPEEESKRAVSPRVRLVAHDRTLERDDRISLECSSWSYLLGIELHMKEIRMIISLTCGTSM